MLAFSSARLDQTTMSATARIVDMDVINGLKLLSLGTSMHTNHVERRITSGIDAGGAQGVSQLQILDHVTKKVSYDSGSSSQGMTKRPCDVFDVIGGVGTGG
jgi:hypothetical protein